MTKRCNKCDRMIHQHYPPKSKSNYCNFCEPEKVIQSIKLLNIKNHDRKIFKI